MAAFRMAWEEGADGIEGDFYLTADGEVVCIHDDTTGRTAGMDLPVKKSNLTELRALEYGSWKNPAFKGEKIPLFSEILDELPSGKWFFIEIKDTVRIVGPIAEILAAKRHDKDRLVFISFDKEVVSACRKTLPGYRTCLISDLKNFSRKGRPDAYLAELQLTGSQGFSFKENAPVTKEWLTKAGGKDGFLMTWTVDDLASALRSVSLGVGFIATNRPGGLRAELATADPI